MDYTTRAILKNLIMFMDWGLIILFFIIAGIIHNHVLPYQKMFSLQDATISYPMAEDIVSDSLLWILALFIPVLVILFIGYIKKEKRSTYYGILGICLSISLSSFLCVITKILIGRPRPDFLHHCQPKSIDQMTSSELPVYGISKINICTQTDPHILKDGTRSFFSGHAATSFSGLGFLSLYLSYTLVMFKRPGSIFKVWSVVLPLVVALIISLSRISDYHHHWEDVLVGLIVGNVCAFFSFKQYFSFNDHKSKEDLDYLPFTINEKFENPFSKTN